MKKNLLCSLLIVFLFGSTLLATESPRNTLYITLDGVGQSTFFQLLRKHQLSGIQMVVDRGNVRTLSMGGVPSQQTASYQTLWTGKFNRERATSPVLPGSTIFEWVAKRYPTTQVSLIPSTISGPSHSDPTDIVPHLTATPITILPDENRKPRVIGAILKQQLSASQDQPFFIFANFPNADTVGHRYRSDGEEYSLVLRRIDRTLKSVFEDMKRNGQWDTTDIIIVPTYSFNRKNRIHQNQSDIWIASTDKVYRKGQLSDIVASIKARYLGQKQFQGTQSLFHQ